MQATLNDCEVTLEGREWDFIADALNGIGQLVSHLAGHADSDTGWRCHEGDEIFASDLAEKITKQIHV